MNESTRIYLTKGGIPHMEQDPTQPIPARHEQLTAEQEAHARTHIENALGKLSVENPIISTETARVIAATLHQGKCSILERFAATGRLNPDVALEEIAALVGTDVNQTWLDALRWHLDEIIHPWPDRRPPDFVEPRPELFVSSPEGTHGQWVSLVADWKDIVVQLGEIDPDWPSRSPQNLQERGDMWTFGKSVGLHGVDLSHCRDLSQAIRIGKGVGQFGESFAAYVKTFGKGLATRLQFLHRHAGSFDNVTQLIEAYAYSWGVLSPDAAPDDTRVRGPTISTRLLERSLREHFYVVEGRTQVHAFERR